VLGPTPRPPLSRPGQEGALQAWSEMLDLLRRIVADAQMQALLDHPQFDSASLADLILDIGGAHFSATGQNFVRVLAEAGRLPLAAAIHSLYEAQRAEAEGVIAVSASAAYALDEAEQKRIIELMARRFGKKVKLSTSIDESLSGGAVIRAGDSVIDASLRGRLKQLANELTE